MLNPVLQNLFIQRLNMFENRVVTEKKLFRESTHWLQSDQYAEPTSQRGMLVHFQSKNHTAVCVDCWVLQKTATDLLNAALPVALQELCLG